MTHDNNNQEVKITFTRGSNKPTIYRIVEGWRKPTKEQAEVIARMEICWFTYPKKAAVTIQGVTFYFNITYKPVYANKAAKKANRYTSLAPEFCYTCKRKAV